MAGKGRLPSAYESDLFAQAPVSTLHAEIPIGNTTADKYYALVFSPFLAKGAVNIRVRAEYVDFYLSSVSPAQGGNAGSTTVRVRGLGFTTNTVVTLAGSGGTIIVGQLPLLLDSTEMFITFDLRGATVGSYDVRLDEPGFPPVVLANGFQVLAGIGPRLETRLVAPSSVRPGRRYTLYVEYENIGDSDLPAPAFQLTNSAHAIMQIGEDGRATDGRLALLGISRNGLVGVLAAHQPQRIPITFTPPSVGPVKFDLIVNPGNETSVDWGEMGQAIKPGDVSEADWNAYLTPAIPQLGTRWGDLLQSLSRLMRDKVRNSERAADLLASVSQAVGLAAESLLYPPAGNGGFNPERDVQLVTNRWESGNNCCVYVVTHGWNASAEDPHIAGLAANIARHCPNCSVLSVDWARGAKTLNPRDASRNIPATAEEAYRKLANALGAGCNWDRVTFVGHSFGNSVNMGISGLAGSNGRGKGRAVILDPPDDWGQSDTEFGGFFEGGSVAFSSDSQLDLRPCEVRDRSIADRHYHIHSGLNFVAGHGRALHCLETQLANAGADCDNRWLNGMAAGPPAAPGSFSGTVDCDGNVTTAQPYTDTDCNNNGTSVPGQSGGSGVSDVVRPIDPNDKLGPAGIGPNRIVPATEAIEYMIRFENRTNATAPVQELVVVDYLDANLDWTTLQFGDIAYGDRLMTVPADALQYSIRDLPPANSPAVTGTTEGPMAVDMSVMFNPQTGRVEWRLKAIDSKTGLPPADALAGLLPPRADALYRNGHVTFSVKPKADAPLGTVITNRATIVFDTEEPIDTPPVWNTLGDTGGGRVAAMSYLPAAALASQQIVAGAQRATAASSPVIFTATGDQMPRLTIKQLGNGVELSWPASAADFTLETTDSRVSQIQWVKLTTSPVVIGGQNTITVSPSDSTRFYRLRKE